MDNTDERTSTKFYIKRDYCNYINELAERNGLTRSRQLERIIEQYRENNNPNLCAQVADAVEDRLYKTLTRIRLGSNGADRNTQVLLEIVNTYLKLRYPDMQYLPMDKYPHLIVTSAQKQVKEKIANYKQAIDDKKRKKKSSDA